METVFQTKEKIRMGIWGLGRGRAFIEQCKALNIEIVAGCDLNEMMREDFRKICPDAFITADEDEFLSFDMDAVLVATYFFAHAGHAIKALKAGKHVLSEVSAFFTPAEGVELVEAVEASGKVYSLAENYAKPFIKKLWKEGIFGELAYAEFNYVHECRPLSYSYLYGDPLFPGNTAHSWRSWFNFHYYCTHSLGALMETTGNRPVMVSAPPSSKNLPGYLPGSESGCMEPSYVTMDNGGIVRNLIGSSTTDSHEQRIWGTRAYVDLTDSNAPIVGVGQCGRSTKVTLTPPKDSYTELAEKAGHGGGDFWVLYHFANAILNGVEPPWSIYNACDVTLTGIMAVKSQYNGGIPVEVPDYRDKAVREQYRNDHFAQKHFDPSKIFPDDQNINETKHFTSIMNDLDRAWKRIGVPLIISALDGMKIYEYITDNDSKLAIQQKVRELLRTLPAIVEAIRQAKELASKYPDAPASKALMELCESAYPEKIADPTQLKKELQWWLQVVDMPRNPQLRMTLSSEYINAVTVPEIPQGFTLRTWQDGDDQAYIGLMQSAGFDYWDQSFADKTKDSALKEGIFFLVEDATGRLAATTMANKIREGHESDGAEFGWVAVNPDFRGHKLAEIVGCAVIDRFRREGYTKLTLFTDDYRLPALKTYLKAGWKPVIPDESTQKRWDAVAKRLNWHFE